MNLFDVLVKNGTIIIMAIVLMYLSSFIRGIYSSKLKDEDDNKYIAYRIVEDIIAFVIRIFILITALSLMGIDVSSLVGLASVATISLGYAFQDLAKNFVSGFLLILWGKMKKNDYIQFIFEEQNLEGEVIDIGLRNSTLRKDNDILYVPNSILFNGVFGVKPTVDVQ